MADWWPLALPAGFLLLMAALTRLERRAGREKAEALRGAAKALRAGVDEGKETGNGV